MSLPEVQLVLEEDQRREASRALVALQSEALAAFAVWDKRAGRRLEALSDNLGKSLKPEKPAESTQVASVLSSWGVSVSET